MSKKKSKTVTSELNERGADQTHEAAHDAGAVALATATDATSSETSEPRDGTTPTVQMAVVATTARKPKAGVKTKKPKTKSAATVSDVAKGYLQHLEESAASSGTLLSYEMELVSAIAELGADKSIASLTVEEVAAFFECTRVMHTRKGGDKSPLSIAKTRRVFRQALVWAVEAGLIETAPLPYDVRKE
jgi:hypothetical protein